MLSNDLMGACRSVCFFGYWVSICFDRRKVHKKLARTSDAATRVMVSAFQVSEILGRSGYHASTVSQRCERLVSDRGDPATGTVLLGHLLHEVREGSKTKQPGAGTSRMRAVLFKAVADWLSVAPCSLHREEAAARGAAGVTWNSVQVDGDSYLVDIMFEPGALYEDGSGKACEYLRRLRQECEEAAAPSKSKTRKAESAAPSLQQNLGGRMLRPSWHVEPWEVEFDRRDRAGRGGFGEVFQGTWAGQQVAVKEVRDASPTDADVCDFVLEISLLSRLSHPNIVRFWRGCVDLRGGHRTLLLVTEWMDRGVLSQLLHESQEPTLTSGQSHVLALGIARGVAYLHHVKILHLDLKSPNAPWHSMYIKSRSTSGAHALSSGISKDFSYSLSSKLQKSPLQLTCHAYCEEQEFLCPKPEARSTAKLPKENVNRLSPVSKPPPLEPPL